MKRLRASMDRRRKTRIPAGFTLVETLASIAIIGLLVAVTLPAVQSARESARQAECRNHLRQILLACHEHEESHGNFAMPGNGYEPWDILLLPYLEQQKPVFLSNGHPQGESPPTIPVYRCPSDPYSAKPGVYYMSSSYFPNDGNGLAASNGFYRKKSGLMEPSDFTDGLSNTAAFSERRAVLDTATFGTEYSNETLWHHRLVRKTSSFIADRDEFADECENHSSPPIVNQLLERSYNSVQTPNRHSCSNGPLSDARSVFYAAITASSLHTGGVHVALADGAVRFVSNAIDSRAWRAIGTRNGNETMGSNF